MHCWPSGSLETLKTAKRLGIPTVLERPNAHTRFCYEAAAKECERLGVETHPEYRYRPRVLAQEEAEFEAADYLLCPSEFTANSFLAQGFPESKILRHMYGFDEDRYFPTPANERRKRNSSLCSSASIRFAKVCTSHWRLGCSRPPSKTESS